MKKYRAIIYNKNMQRMGSKTKEFKTFEEAVAYAEKNATEANERAYNIQSFWDPEA